MIPPSRVECVLNANFSFLIGLVSEAYLSKILLD